MKRVILFYLLMFSILNVYSQNDLLPPTVMENVEPIKMPYSASDEVRKIEENLKREQAEAIEQRNPERLAQKDFVEEEFNKFLKEPKSFEKQTEPIRFNASELENRTVRKDAKEQPIYYVVIALLLSLFIGYIIYDVAGISKKNQNSDEMQKKEELTLRRKKLKALEKEIELQEKEAELLRRRNNLNRENSEKPTWHS